MTSSSADTGTRLSDQPAAGAVAWLACDGCGDADPGHHVQGGQVTVRRTVLRSDTGAALAVSTQRLTVCDACLSQLAALVRGTHR